MSVPTFQNLLAIKSFDERNVGMLDLAPLEPAPLEPLAPLEPRNWMAPQEPAPLEPSRARNHGSFLPTEPST